jgi:hypothetical protein
MFYNRYIEKFIEGNLQFEEGIAMLVITALLLILTHITIHVILKLIYHKN